MDVGGRLRREQAVERSDAAISLSYHYEECMANRIKNLIFCHFHD